MNFDYEFLQVFINGGPVMIALAITSLLMYKTIIGLLVFVRRVRIDELVDARLSQPGREHVDAATVGFAQAMQKRVEVLDEMRGRLKQLVRSRIKYSHALLIAAPLLGLLGTVMGMLDTFHGISLQLGRETATAVADGISRALITTETGLMIAIPGLFLIHWIKRELQRQELRILEKKTRMLLGMEN